MTPAMVSLLSAMLGSPASDWYGFELSKSAGLKSGTIYPALARLERYRWLEGHWEDLDPSAAGRPRRRLYRLTGEGEVAVRRKLEELESQLARARAVRGIGLPPRGQLA